MDPNQNLDLRSYLRVLDRRKWLIALTVVITVAATALATWRMTPIYEGEAVLYLQPPNPGSAEQLLDSLLDDTTLRTQVELIKSDEVLRMAAGELGVPALEDLKDATAVQLVPDTQIVEVRVEHERPDEAAAWANAVAEAFLAWRRDQALQLSLQARQDVMADIEELETQLGALDPAATGADGLQRDRLLNQIAVRENELRDLPEQNQLLNGGGSVISPAQQPTEPVRPKEALNLALALVIGGMLGLGLAFLAENLDDRLKSPEEVEALIGAPILGYIPVVKEWLERDRSGIAMFSETTSGAAEAYRTLRTNLNFVALERPLKTILVTGPVAEVGKSTCSANLAATLAAGGSKVILISADLRRPSVHKLFGLTNSAGLVSVLQDDRPLRDVLQSTDLPTLKVLAAGGLPPNPTEILASGRFGRILEQLRALADYVVLDAPPVLGLGDASALASRTDGTLFVARPGQVTKREIAHSVEQLHKAGGRVIGCLLNGVEENDGYGYYYRYYYSQYQPEANGLSAQSNGRKSVGGTSTDGWAARKKEDPKPYEK